jgi:hypothetical protein
MLGTAMMSRRQQGAFGILGDDLDAHARPPAQHGVGPIAGDEDRAIGGEGDAVGDGAGEVGEDAPRSSAAVGADLEGDEAAGCRFEDPELPTIRRERSR